MRSTQVFTTSRARAADLTVIRDLLDRAFAGAFSDADWEHTLGGSHVIVTESGALCAHAAVVPRVLEIDGAPFTTGYVEGVATLPERQGRGLGSLVMRRAMRLIRCGYELGALSTSRHSFYERLGWERWHGPTFVRHGPDVLRTPDEDAGVMVLRHGASAAVDLTAAISCDARRGDDW